MDNTTTSINNINDYNIDEESIIKDQNNIVHISDKTIQKSIPRSNTSADDDYMTNGTIKVRIYKLKKNAF